MKKINIVFIIPSMRIGGTQKFLSYLVNNLSDKFIVHLVVINGSLVQQNIDFLKVNYYNLDCKRVILSIPKIYKILKKIKPDIVFSFQSHLSIYLIFFKKLFNRKIIFLARESNLPSKKHKSYNNPNFRDFLYRSFMYRYDLIVCQSEDMIKDIINFNIPLNKTVKINNPININYVLNKSKLKLDNSGFKYDFIVCAANLGHQKGLYRLIEAVYKIRKKVNKIVILGDGPNRLKLQKKINQFGLEDIIFLVGKTTNPYNWIIKSKVVLLSSFFEGFPNILLEAGALKKPCVVFNVKGGINEIIDHKLNGFIANDNDLDQFSSFMLKALSYDFEKEYIFDKINNNFNIKKIISIYEKTIINLIDNAKR